MLSNEEINLNIDRIILDNSNVEFVEIKRNRLEEIANFMICMFSIHLVFGFDENTAEAVSYECKFISRYSVFEIVSEIIHEHPDILSID